MKLTLMTLTIIVNLFIPLVATAQEQSERALLEQQVWNVAKETGSVVQRPDGQQFTSLRVLCTPSVQARRTFCYVYDLLRTEDGHPMVIPVSNEVVRQSVVPLSLQLLRANLSTYSLNSVVSFPGQKGSLGQSAQEGLLWPHFSIRQMDCKKVSENSLATCEMISGRNNR